MLPVESTSYFDIHRRVLNKFPKFHDNRLIGLGDHRGQTHKFIFIYTYIKDGPISIKPLLNACHLHNKEIKKNIF